MILDKNNMDSTILNILDSYINKIEEAFIKKGVDADIISYTGIIEDSLNTKFREFIEIKKHDNDILKEKLIIILETGGGSARAVEKMVNIVRYHYTELYFVIPDYAMSAGTIFSMAGDKIYMDYSSSLGPVDPQVLNDKGQWIPALGYIDKVNELIEKSRNSVMTDAEFLTFQKLDLGTIRSYEQAKELSVDLLKKWLVKYKFKQWTTHRTTSEGTPVTQSQKEELAEHIAEQLSDNKKWHSHGRYININTLRELKLEIEDYSEEHELRKAIISYNNLLKEFVQKMQRIIFFHTRLNRR
jgi:membrane-bound ClpP family serine protease